MWPLLKIYSNWSVTLFENILQDYFPFNVDNWLEVFLMLKIDYKAVEFGFCFVVFYAHSYIPTIKTGHAILNDTRKNFVCWENGLQSRSVSNSRCFLWSLLNSYNQNRSNLNYVSKCKNKKKRSARMNMYIHVLHVLLK